MAPTPFLDPGLFPELVPVRASWHELRDEARAALPAMRFIEDSRAEPRTWAVLPFEVEEDDRSVVADDTCRRNRAMAPRTVELVDLVPDVMACAFSSLAPGATISAHRHHRPLITASLCLQGGRDSRVEVGGEIRRFIDGEWMIFDYTLVHEVTNAGAVDRIVLLIALRNPFASLGEPE